MSFVFFYDYCCDCQLITVLFPFLFNFDISVQASIAANTWVVSGSPQTKSKFFFFFFQFGSDMLPFTGWNDC